MVSLWGFFPSWPDFLPVSVLHGDDKNGFVQLILTVFSFRIRQKTLLYRFLCIEGDDDSFHRGSTPLVLNCCSVFLQNQQPLQNLFIYDDNGITGPD